MFLYGTLSELCFKKMIEFSQNVVTLPDLIIGGGHFADFVPKTPSNSFYYLGNIMLFFQIADLRHTQLYSNAIHFECGLNFLIP